MKGLRTEDNIMVLNTLFEKYVTKNSNKLFVAFVDFSKYFDSIIRVHLFSKLLQNGIGGKFYRLLKDMYNGISFKIKTLNGYTKNFFSTSESNKTAI